MVGGKSCLSPVDQKWKLRRIILILETGHSLE
jgi:hypothetical protein